MMECRIMLKTVEKTLDRTSGNNPLAGKETWWWNEEVQGAFKTKLKIKTRWDASRTEDDKCRFKAANKQAQKATTRAYDKPGVHCMTNLKHQV